MEKKRDGGRKKKREGIRDEERDMGGWEVKGLQGGRKGEKVRQAEGEHGG